MTTLAELVDATPAPGRGIPTQLSSGSGTWRWVLELADPSAGAAVVWYDVTGLCAGIESTRGSAAFAGRYEASVVELEFVVDDDSLAPWNDDTSPTFGTHVELGAGLLIRGGLIRVNAGVVAAWRPRFTARVETWPDATFARGQIRRHQVTARDLSVELVNVPIAGDLADNWLARAEHVLTEAGWSYGATIYGAEFDSGAGNILTEPDSAAAESAIGELDAALDPAGVVWFTNRRGQIIARPQPGDTFHADAFTAGATGLEYTPPAAAVFSHLAEDGAGIGYVVDDTAGRPFGIDSTELTVINHVRVTDPVFTPYDTDDPVSIERYGRRTRSLNWVVANNTPANDMLARLAFAHRQATPLQTTADLPGFFPAMGTLDYLDPVTITYTTGPGRSIVTADGRVRQLVEQIAPRGAAGIDWRVTVTADIDTADPAADMLPVTDLTVTDTGHDQASFSWANPAQTIIPTATQVRVPQQSQLWVEIGYPVTAMTWLGLQPVVGYQLDVRLIRRVDGLVTNVSPVASVAFTTDPAPGPVVTPDGTGGLDVDLPDVGECVINWALESSDDGGDTWVTVTSGTAASGETINVDSSVLEDGLIYRVSSQEDCGGVLGPTFYSPVVVPTCQTPADYPLVDPYSRSDLIAFVPEICSPDVVVEAVSQLAGEHGPAWGGVTNAGGDVAVAADGSAGGIIAYGETPGLDYTGAATIECTASVQVDGEAARLFGVAGLRLDAVAGVAGWYPSASVTTFLGDEISVTDASLRPLITELELRATYDDDTGTLELFVNGTSVGTVTAEEPAARAGNGGGWHVGAPAASWVTRCAVWSSVLEAPLSGLYQTMHDHADMLMVANYNEASGTVDDAGVGGAGTVTSGSFRNWTGPDGVDRLTFAGGKVSFPHSAELNPAQNASGAGITVVTAIDPSVVSATIADKVGAPGNSTVWSVQYDSSPALYVRLGRSGSSGAHRIWRNVGWAPPAGTFVIAVFLQDTVDLPVVTVNGVDVPMTSFSGPTGTWDSAGTGVLQIPSSFSGSQGPACVLNGQADLTDIWAAAAAEGWY